MIFTMPDAPTILAYATLLGVLGGIIQSWRNGKVSADTNKMVNGVHSTALNAITTQAAQIASLTGNPADQEKLKVAAFNAAVQEKKITP